MSSARRGRPALGEFVALMALMTSLTALAIDAMLPALAEIGNDLGAPTDNSRQLVVSALFLGMATAQIFYGPLADRYGRKPPIYASLAIFIGGSLISIVATDFNTMLAGRFLQGVGSAGPRIVTMAIVRDQYKGDAMARVMSLIMAVFILVPTLAPAIGQGILLVANWRMIFVVLLLQALLALAWFSWRQPETLSRDRRLPLTPKAISTAALEVCRNRIAFGYTLTGGLVFGAFIGFLISVQQILQEQYALGELFPLYFAALALTIGSASYLNAKLVMRYGMRLMSNRALLILCVLSFGYWLFAYAAAGQPSLWSLMAFFMAAFGCIGILLGNLNTLAMESLGHIAGMAAAVIGSLTTLISLLLGTLIGQRYDGTVLPLVAGFALLSAAAIIAVRWTEAGRRTDPAGQLRR